MNPREVISDPHILITNQLNPVTCNRSETEQAAGVVPNAPPEERVDRELEDWVAEARKKTRGSARFADGDAGLSGIRILGAHNGRVFEGLGRSSPGCRAVEGR